MTSTIRSYWLWSLLATFFVNLSFSQISFSTSELSGSTAVNPTCLAFGPDNRLYVSEKDGMIYAYTLDRLGPNNYVVTSTEVIDLINAMPNYDDDTGNRNFTVFQRQVTGLLAAGTAANPVLYVSNSDPRQGAGTSGDDKNLDTNSGIISRLSWNGSSWVKVDLVRGLPRSEENHATNGLHLDSTGGVLYVSSAGFTNAGSPSNNFAFISETALSAAILAIDLNAINALPVQTDAYGYDYLYALPTTDDPTRANVNGITDPSDPGYDGIDVNDPFGGNDGLNQAKLVPGGPVQIYAPGFRNAYDIEITQAGRMYTIDNGANPGWGGYPEQEGTANVTNNYVPGEPGFVNNANGLHYVSGPGYYGGHPNPTRANPAGAGLYTHDGTGVFRTSTTGPNPLPADWPPLPVSMANPIEADFQQPGVDDPSLITYGPSTNGIAEYTATNFGGAMQGNLICAGYNGDIFRAIFNATGDAVVNGVQTISSGVATQALDLLCRGDGESFPGTIWISDFADDKIIIMEPADYGGAPIPPCTADNNPTLDEDNDGFDNADEIANGTDPCSASSVPPDNDQDFESDLLDPDDDNDGIADVNDPFAIDATNGLNTPPRLHYDFFNQDPGTGFFGIGFMGLMVNGSTDYLNQFDENGIVAGGTAGLVTIPTTAGDAALGPNNQDNAFQFGVHLDSDSCRTRVRGRILAPFFGGMPASGSQSMGIYVGTGDQDNYVKIVIDGNITVITENGGSPSFANYLEPLIADAGTHFVDLELTVDPANGTVQPAYSVNNGPVILAGPELSLSGSLLTALQTNGTAIAVGIISTHYGATAFSPTWDYLEVDVAPSPAEAVFTVEPSTGSTLNASSHQPGSFSITNNSPAGQNIERVLLDLSTTALMDMLFDPNGLAGDDLAKTFTPDAGTVETGFSSFAFSHGRDNGFEQLDILFTDFGPGETFSFSLDIDPSSIQGTAYPGPDSAGHVSGLELSGATVKVFFSDCAVQSGQLFPLSGSLKAAQAQLRAAPPSAPSLEVLGLPAGNSEVTEASQTVRITGGPANGTVRLLRMEGGFYVQGAGFDPDDFEANSVNAVMEYPATLSASGTADIPLTLTASNLNAGLNHLLAVVQDANGSGAFSNMQIVKLNNPTCDVVLINAGGAAYSAVDGSQFTADQFFTGGEAQPFGGPQGQSIAGTNDDLLYQTYRSKVYGGASFTYAIPIVNGQYMVKLHFAELFFTANDAREFDVSIEGVQVLDNHDIFETVGFETADIQAFTTTVSDGSLDLVFTSIGGHDSPTLAGIEVLEACPPTTFPVELLSFTAIPNGPLVDIRWETASESNNAYFSVQRSVDGQAFEVLEVVPGAGNSQQLRSYHRQDLTPILGTSFYRLKQTDADGHFSYSPVVEVHFEPARPDFRLFPNPLSGQYSRLELAGFRGREMVELQLLDLQGKRLLYELLQTDARGSLKTRLQLPPSLNPGVYVVRLSTASHTLSKRLIWMP